MAATIRAKIQLDGAEDVSSQLQRLKGVFTDTGQAAEAIGASFSNFIGVVQKAVAAFAIIETAAIATTAAFRQLGTSATNAIDSIGDSADAVGLSVKEYQQLSGAAEAAGISASSIDRIFRKISVDAEEAANGTGKFAQKFKDAGVKLTDFYGNAKSTTQILKELADRYSQLDQSKRPEFLKSLGFRLKDAAELAQLLSVGSKGIEDFIKTAEKVKYVPTDKDNEIVGRSVAAASLLKDAWQKFSIEVGKAFIPLSTNIDIGFINLLLRITEPLSRLTEYIASKAKPVIEDFFNMLTGGNEFNNEQFVIWQAQIETILARFPAFYSTYIEPFITGLTAGIQRGLYTVAYIMQGIVDTISAILEPVGVALEPVRKALATIITPEVAGYVAGLAAVFSFILIPAFNATMSVISLITASFGALSALLGPTGALFVAVAALTYLIAMNWDSIKAKTIEVFSNLGSIVSAGIESAKQSALSGLDAIASYFTSKFEGIKSSLIGWFGWLSGAISDALKSVSDLGGKTSGALGGSKAGFFASGGYVSGAGSGTSDSIPAWLSNGEFVIRAASVRKLGLGLLNSINNGFVPPSLSYGRFGYAGGGLVGATGGLSGGRPLTLVIDGRQFGGLSGSDDVIGNLEKYTSLRQLSSTSKRTPSRVG